LIAGISKEESQADPDKILRQFATLLASGRYKILGSPIRGLRSGSAEQEPEERAEAAKAPQLSNKSWIEFNLRDDKGQPVPGEKYRITLPDASVQEGNLDAMGHAEYYGINAGMCEISFPDLEDDQWGRSR
jgi:hypothetical protein